jgi:glycosyltransferase involved in cell wall biosynthesis
MPADKKFSMLLIGPIPPPAGGVSIHLWRLMFILKHDFSIDFVDESRNKKRGVFNIRELKFLSYFRKLLGSQVVSIHSGLNALRYFHILAAKICFRKVVLTLHAYPEEKKPLKKWLDECIFNRCDRIIAVNSDILERISLTPRKIQVMHAFLPPVMAEENALPVVIADQIKLAQSQGKTIICSNAWRLDRFNNEDLYGVDMCIEAVRSLKQQGFKILFIFNIATIDMYGKQYDAYQQNISSLGLTEDFRLTNELLSFVRLMEKSDLAVRPTNTDGDSLSIREALFLGVPIIASDVLVRPEGTLLFSNRNQADFEEKIKSVLSAPRHHQLTDQRENLEHYRKSYQRLFTGLLN